MYQQAGGRAHYNRFLLTENQRDRIDVVLVSPRNPLNIGAVARAMANFGFVRLAVVTPYEAHWREARSAVDAEDVLKSARVYATLAEAVADCTLVLGTGTLTYRKPEQPVVPLSNLAPHVERELEHSGRVALVFGPEKHGLTREDLAQCHMLVEIPTDARQPSMNLGQAAAVCLYELASRALVVPHQEIAGPMPPGRGDSGARGGDLERLAGLVEETMVAAGYSPHTMRAANQHDLRVLLRRLHLSAADTRRILGLFRRILWRLGHVAGNSDRRG